MTELAPEDTLRLQVLLSNQPQVIRIDESGMSVHALCPSAETGHEEFTIHLHPTCRDELYLRLVRQLLSEFALGFSGGYPVLLNRWSRLNPTPSSQIMPLLLLGEPEAVSAAVHCDAITAAQGRLAWWALPSAEVARRLLATPEIVSDELGPELATFLVDYLPFETEPENIVATLGRVLQPGLVGEETRQALWQKAQRKTSLMLGFLLAAPESIPAGRECRKDFQCYDAALRCMAENHNPLARLLHQALSASGQNFLGACRTVVQRPEDQFIVVKLIDTIARYFSVPGQTPESVGTLDAIQHSTKLQVECASEQTDIMQLLMELPDLQRDLIAALTLAQINDNILQSALGSSNATGALMRRKLNPVLTALDQELGILLGDRPD